jgi:hypothetical protein
MPSGLTQLKDGRVLLRDIRRMSGVIALSFWPQWRGTVGGALQVRSLPSLP